MGIKELFAFYKRFRLFYNLAQFFLIDFVKKLRLFKVK